MTGDGDGNEGGLKGIVPWAALIAVICAAGFWFTIVKPNEMQLYPGDGVVPGTVSNEKDVLYLSSQKVLNDIYDMEPSRLMREGDVDGALGAARQLMDKDKWNVKNLMCAGNVFVDAPKDRGETEEGFDLLKTATYMCPTSKYVRLNYARALGRAGRIEEATKQYDQVIKANMDFEPSLELARLYMTNLDEEKAINLLKSVSDKDPENSSVQMLLGIAMARNHQEKDGFEEYIQAFGKARTLGYPLEAKDLVEKNHDSVPDAIKEQKSVADAPKAPIEAKLLLAEMLILQNRVSEAKVVLDAEKVKYKENAELHRLYAEIYHTENKEEQAYQEWLTANTCEKKADEEADAGDKPDADAAAKTDAGANTDADAGAKNDDKKSGDADTKSDTAAGDKKSSVDSSKSGTSATTTKPDTKSADSASEKSSVSADTRPAGSEVKPVAETKPVQ